MNQTAASQNKIAAGEFNNCPGRDAIEAAIEKLEIGLEYVDLDRPYWQNKADTMVFRLNAASPVNFAKLVHEIQPDEFQETSTRDHQRILRFWWD